MNDTNSPMTASTEKTIGPIVGSLIIVVVLILGALYFWSQMLNTTSTTSTTTPNGAATREPSPKNDDLRTLKSDLDSTNINKIDAQLKTIQ